MTDVPKIVHDRLRAALPGRILPGGAEPEQVHPDADVLTAFAEQALSATERDGLLQHLALCGDCREVVAVALPPADIAAAPIVTDTDGLRTTVSKARAPHKLSFAWPTLRWAALAAGIAVAGAVLLLHPGKLNQATLPSANPQVATNVPPASGAQPASSSMDQSAALAKTNEPRAKSESRLSRKLKSEQVVTPTTRAEPGMLLADNKKDSGVADQLSAAPSARARAFEFDARSSRAQASTETVEVTGAAAVAGELAPSANGNLMARNSAPPNDAPAIEKAKPAPPEMAANEEQKAPAPVIPGPARLQARNVMSAARLASTATESVAPHVSWTIVGGVLQRSLDGQSWQDALHPDHLLLCYTSHDDDVWAGGQGGTLFHSSDSGVTWAQVQPSIKARLLRSDITHIELRNTELRRDELRSNAGNDLRRPAEVILSTRDNEFWSSPDGGKTWDKK